MLKRRHVILCLVCGLFVLGFAADTAAWEWGTSELKLETSGVKLARETMRGGYKLVKTDELKSWIDQDKDMLIIDAMPYEASYKKNHIPGAKNFLFPIPEMNEMDAKTKADYLGLLGPDRDRPIVVYCGFVKCTRSHNGAMWAVKLGYTNVYRHPGGIKAWKQAGYATEEAE